MKAFLSLLTLCACLLAGGPSQADTASDNLPAIYCTVHFCVREWCLFDGRTDCRYDNIVA